jgi:hypothetical protein
MNPKPAKQPKFRDLIRWAARGYHASDNRATAQQIAAGLTLGAILDVLSDEQIAQLEEAIHKVQEEVTRGK